MAAAICGTMPIVQANAATTLALAPRDSPAASVYSAPVPGEAITISDVIRNSGLTAALLGGAAIGAPLWRQPGQGTRRAKPLRRAAKCGCGWRTLACH